MRCLAVLLVLSGAMAVLVHGPATQAQTPPSASDITAYSGLHRAVATGDLAAVQAVLVTMPDLEARDGHGRTAAHVAAHRGAGEIIEALAAAGANLNALDSRRYDVVTILAVADRPAVLRTAIRLGAKATNITSPYEGTALIAAAHLGHDEVVRILIEAGAPLDHVNNLGWTALMEAIVLGDGGPRHTRCLQALLVAGADRTIPDKAGVTPLIHAERAGYRAMADALRAR